MYFHHILFASLFTLVQCVSLPSSSRNLLLSLNLTVDELGATVFSLLYGDPLIAFAQLAEPLVVGLGTNVLASQNSTSTASTRNVVRPNVDTLYAAGTFDLSANDVGLTVPDMEEDRFYLFAFYDPLVTALCLRWGT